MTKSVLLFFVLILLKSTNVFAGVTHWYECKQGELYLCYDSAGCNDTGERCKSSHSKANLEQLFSLPGGVCCSLAPNAQGCFQGC